MPSIFCLGCQEQKRSKTDKFYSSDLISLISHLFNQSETKIQRKKAQVNEINDISVASKICKSCYDLARSNSVAVNQNTPDLTIYRKGLNSHTQCTFCCKTIRNLISIPKDTYYLQTNKYRPIIDILSHIHMLSSSHEL